MSKGDLTIETILEEKKLFDLSLKIEKVGVGDEDGKWSLPGNPVLLYRFYDFFDSLTFREHLSSFSAISGFYPSFCGQSSTRLYRTVQEQ